jgi:UDP:flavonoid glycosyltransferase YjiC (YdhE family)
MKTLLFAPETINIAETTRMIEIARACRPHFRCVFFGYSDRFSGLIEQAGFEFRRMQPWLTDAKIEHLWKVDRLESFDDPFTEAELRARVKSELALYNELNPSALVIGFTLSTVLSARVAGLPLVYVIPFPLSRPFLEANQGTWPDAFDSPLLGWLPKRWLDTAANRWMLNTRLWIMPFARLAGEYGLAPIRRLVDIYEGDYTLLTDIPELTGITSLPENWHYIGPIFAHLPGEIPPAILSLPRDQPLIYCAMGSSANHAILKKVIESFSGAPYTVIAPIQAHLANGPIQVPANVHVFDWLPADKVNPLADLAVIHGGQGTVQTACHSGTPFIGIGLQPEQESNIDMVVRYGSALRIRKSRLSQHSLLQAIETLLASPSARERATSLQAIFQRWAGVANAASFIRTTFS